MCASVALHDFIACFPMAECSFCRAGGLRDVTRVVFCNNECHARFGSPRPQAEALELFNSLPEDEKQAARKWQIKMYQVITQHCQRFAR